MSRRPRVQFSLDAGNIKKLPENDIKMILRAADELISTGGRNMLVKILKGSRDKKVLEHGLDTCPAYGFYRELTMEEISHRVDWMIRQDYIRIDYYGRLPMIIFSEKGWEIEAETYAEELFQRFLGAAKAGKGKAGSAPAGKGKAGSAPAGKGKAGSAPADTADDEADALLAEMKDVNRQVVLAVLEMIRASKDADFIPLLEKWKAQEVRKVRERITSVEKSLDHPAEAPLTGFRKAVKGDLGAVTELIHKTVRTVYPAYYPAEVADFFCMYHCKERILPDIQAGNVWILLLDGRIIGTGSIEENHITRFYVLPEFQRKGYGTRIMQELEKRIGENYETVELDSSLVSSFLYEKLGYHTIRREQMHLMNGVVLVYEVMGKRLEK